jgi:hypothetical protein
VATISRAQLPQDGHRWRWWCWFIALVLAWAFDITPEGVRRTQEATETAASARRGSWLRPASASGYIGVGIIIGLVAVGAYARRDNRRPGADGDRITDVAVLPFENMTGRRTITSRTASRRKSPPSSSRWVGCT